MELKHKQEIVIQWIVVHQHIQHIVDMEVVLHHVVVEQNIEQDTLTVITTDNNVVVGPKVHHVIHKDVVIQLMDQVDTGQDVVQHVIQELKTTIVTDIVTTMGNIVEQ